ncbi:hypothetical protein GN956_G3822 [Arapaima gigas]
MKSPAFSQRAQARLELLTECEVRSKREEHSCLSLLLSQSMASVSCKQGRAVCHQLHGAVRCSTSSSCSPAVPQEHRRTPALLLVTRTNTTVHPHPYSLFRGPEEQLISQSVWM